MSNKINYLYEFEDFRLDTQNPSLWRGDQLVSISPKALELLILLVAKNGEIVSRDEVLNTVWKDTFVEESNINYTISLLRKTLDSKDLIQTVPRRGYRFVAPVKNLAPNSERAEFPEPAAAQVELAVEKSPVRWIFAGVLLVSIAFLSSFTFWWSSVSSFTAPINPRVANAEAMQAYTRGKMIVGRRDVENREEKAIDEFQKAITLDPTFALAYAGLAEGYATYAVVVSNAHSGENYTKAKVAAEKALTLDGNLAEGYLIRGWLRRNADWDWQGAELDLRRAITLDPKNALAHQRLAQVLSPIGRHDEALAEINLAYELDPISDPVLSSRFPILEARRDYDTALKTAENLLRENKENNNTIRAYATFLYHKEDYAKVIELGETALAKDSNKTAYAWLSLLAAAYQKTNQFDKSDAALRQLEILSQNDTKALYSLAVNYAELGRSDEAINALQKCFEQRESRLIWLNMEPRFIKLRNDVRFRELLRKMNLFQAQ